MTDVPSQTDTYFFEEGEMIKLTASLTRKASIEMPSGNWTSFEASFAIEDEVPSGTNKESFSAGLNCYVMTVVDAVVEVQLG